MVNRKSLRRKTRWQQWTDNRVVAKCFRRWDWHHRITEMLYCLEFCIFWERIRDGHRINNSNGEAPRIWKVLFSSLLFSQTLDLWICSPPLTLIRRDLKALIRRFNIYDMFSMFITVLSMTCMKSTYKNRKGTTLFYMTNIPRSAGSRSATWDNLSLRGGLQHLWKGVLTCVLCHPGLLPAVCLSGLCPPP